MEKTTTLLKKIYTVIVSTRISFFLIFCLAFNSSFARETTKPLSLGTVKEFKSSFSKADPAAKKFYVLRLESNKEVIIKITDNNCKKNDCYVFGTVEGHEQATFFIKGNGKSVNGKVIFRKTKKAYDIYTNGLGEVFIAPIDINKVICVDYEEYKNEEGKNEGDNNSAVLKNSDGTMAAPLLNSLPGAYGTLYLDFDGENVSGGSWGTINASPSSFTNANITTIWTAVSEDYSPFNLNVTTDRAVFNSATPTRRMMVIFTPTSTAAPGAGGVAYLNSFGSGDPCWIFNNSVKSAEEAASHESGHTFGLNHDGTSTQGYSAGHANWGPIMGAVYSRPIVQWSKGEYTDANNQEDDVTKISTKVPYRVDDAGNTPAAAKPLIVTASGSVAAASNFGVIEKRTDLDVFKFTTTGGTVSFSITAKTEPGSASVPDLDIQARLLDAGGTQIVKVDPTSGVLTTVVTLSQSLAAGTYYLEIDGVGYGTALSTGYSDYASLGQYFISGTVPGGATTGINEIANNHEINVFPNPSSGAFTINVPVEGNNECSIEILNSLGQPVMISSENSSGNIYKEIDLSSHAAGIYCIMVRSGNDVWKGKVLLK